MLAVSVLRPPSGVPQLPTKGVIGLSQPPSIVGHDANYMSGSASLGITVTPMSDSTVSGDISIQAVPTNATAVSQIYFYLDSTFEGTDLSAPYCLGGSTFGICTPFDTASLSNGAHTIKAFMSYNQGSLEGTLTHHRQRWDSRSHEHDDACSCLHDSADRHDRSFDVNVVDHDNDHQGCADGFIDHHAVRRAQRLRTGQRPGREPGLRCQLQRTVDIVLLVAPQGDGGAILGHPADGDERSQSPTARLDSSRRRVRRRGRVPRPSHTGARK